MLEVTANRACSMSTLGITVLSLVVAASAFASGPAHDVAATLGSLRGIEVPEDPFATDVPPVARVLMAHAKSELLSLTGSLLRDQPAEMTAPATAVYLSAALLKALDASGAFEKCDSQYGTLLPPEVTTPAGDLIAVQTALAIPCGQDASLFLFRRENGQWRLVLDRERNDYEEVSGGAGDFRFRVSPPDAHGAFLVISADITPWCTSNWQALRYDVVRINRGWRDPEPIADGVEYIFLEDEIGMDVSPDTFSLTFVGSSIDPARLTRNYQRHYRIEPGNRVTRIEPIAGTPLEFVEEWLLMNKDQKVLEAGDAGEFAQPVRCADGVWEIEYDLYSKGDDDEQEAVYFYVAEVAEKNATFSMVSAGEALRDGCDDK